MNVDEAILTRRSVRAFKPDPVPLATVRHILEVASRAPSGSNIQPWKVWVVAGDVRDRVCREAEALRAAKAPELEREFAYYPETFEEPYLSRRRATGWGLYNLLDIKRGESARMEAQHARNQQLFDAPVGLFFTIEKSMQYGSWLDHGTFLQNVMLAARNQGLHTCPQASWSPYHAMLRRVLGIPEGEHIVSGMALGHADDDKPENALRTPRAPVEEWATFLGFE